MTPGRRDARAHRRRRCPTGLRGRTLAVLGAAGLLAGGYALATTQVQVTGAPAVARPVSAPPVSAPPVPAGTVDGRTEVWAQRASVALVSVNRQLDTLAHAEQEWTRLPESRRAGRPPALAALAERRSVLQRRQATLQSQLDAYRAVQESRRDLAVSEQHLAALETALVDVPPAPRRSAEQAAAVAALAEQRDLRVRQRDAQRTEVESLEEAVAAATALPLPDDDASTERVSNDLLAAVRDDGDAPGDPDEGELRLPQILPGREQDDIRPRQEAETSGPPDPRGPRHGGEDRNGEKDRDGKGRGGKGRDEKAAVGEAHARGTQSPDEQADDKPADKRGDDKRADDKRADDKRADDKRADDKRADDKRADDKQADDKRGDDKRGDDKRGDDKRGDDKRGDDDHRDEDRTGYDRELEDATIGRPEPARIVLRLVSGGRVAAAPIDETRASSIASNDRIPGGSSQHAAEKTSAGEKPTDTPEKKPKKEKAEKKKSEKKSGEKSGDTTSEKKSSEKKSSEKKSDNESGRSSDARSSADDTSDD